jgi:hypothetical protein
VNRPPIRRATTWFWRALYVLPGALLLWALPGKAPALVNPVTLIQRQVIKPNMLLVLDTSTSMEFAPGDRDLNSAEVGMDCDKGDSQCRMIGLPGRCFYAGTGAMGAGVSHDYTSCHTDADCRTGWCYGNEPDYCSRDSDCSSGYCQGYCDNNNTRACTRDSGCLSGGHCRGICSSTISSSTACTNDNQCGGSNDYCNVYGNDVCITSGSQIVSKTCSFGGSRCRTDADCSALNAGDTCVGASSRLVIAKRVLSNIVSTYYTKVNFGLMTFYQTNYFPYYKVSGSVTYNTLNRFFGKDQLAALGCWTKTAGPSASCTVDTQVYTLKASANSVYRLTTSGGVYSDLDSSWCGSLWCPVSGGTGYYQGSYFTYQDPVASLASLTPSIQSTYQGPVITISGSNYVYWNPPIEMRNSGNVYLVSPGPEPIAAGDGDQTLPCTDKMGGRADTVVAPFMDTTDSAAKAQALITSLTLKLDKAHLGGLAAEGFTPTGCTLAYDNTTYATTSNNALSYMKAVKAADTLSCRNNYVLLVTDGWPTRSYDDSCDDSRCSAADPTGAGCPCWAVKASQKLKTNGIKTYVVGFGQATQNAYATTTLNNIARAGGTSTGAMFANNEQQLYDSMVKAIYDAAQGSYSTSPASASSGTQQASTVSLGTMLLDTRVDFPGWKGQVIAYETSSGSPVLAWSANTVSFNAATDPNFWKKRNVWTSNGTSMVKIDVNSSTGAINNASTLATLGLGADATEATRVARWLLGDPSMKNPAVLGAVINSTPIDVGPPGNSPLPGGAAYYNAYLNRPNLTYVGSSDGMLHAFFTKSATIGGTTFAAGQEAFAYIPQTMLQVALKLYAQGGQLPDPKDHIYGLANSPKVKSLCTANCDGSSGTPVWKTLLAMAYGFGGTEAFVIDITNPFSATGVNSATTSPPASLLWNTQYLSPSTTSAYDNDLGLTTSVPAFYYAKGASKDDFRMIFGSYSSNVSTGAMGKVVLNSAVRDGAMIDADTITPGTTCTQAFGLLTDVGTARNFASGQENQILAAYFGDTWGNLYRYVPTVSGTNNYTGTTGTVSTVQNFGCNQPVHYMPAIVQLDRDNAINHPGEIYLVQVTNSALDDETKSFPASQMIVRRDLGTSAGGSVTADTTWTNIVLTAGTNLCGVTNASGTCTSILPAGARPNATPLAVLRQDGLGFDVLSTWYYPPTDGCTDGVTYLNIYQINVDGTSALKYATQLASEPITSTVFVGGKLMFASQSGVTDLTALLPASLSFGPGTAGNSPPAAERFHRLSWTETP